MMALMSDPTPTDAPTLTDASVLSAITAWMPTTRWYPLKGQQVDAMVTARESGASDAEAAR